MCSSLTTRPPLNPPLPTATLLSSGLGAAGGQISAGWSVRSAGRLAGVPPRRIEAFIGSVRGTSIVASPTTALRCRWAVASRSTAAGRRGIPPSSPLLLAGVAVAQGSFWHGADIVLAVTVVVVVVGRTTEAPSSCWRWCCADCISSTCCRSSYTTHTHTSCHALRVYKKVGPGNARKLKIEGICLPDPMKPYVKVRLAGHLS